MAKAILVTPRSLTREGDPALERLRQAGYQVVLTTPGRQPDETELLQRVEGCVGWLAGVEPITARILETARQLRVISRNGVGVDNIDLEAAKRLGIRVVRADSANARGVAELTIGLMLALTRSIPWSDARLKAGTWERRRGVEIAGRVVGLVGCGKIGKLVARLVLGLGGRVLAHDALPTPDFAPEGFRYASFDELLATADIVSLHCPAHLDRRPLIDSQVIERMKRGTFLINTARASLVQGADVLSALESGRLAGFATDVFTEEPPAPEPLLAHERVIVTPHIGGFTNESVAKATGVAVDNLLGALAEAQHG